MALKITINIVISLFDRGDIEHRHFSSHFPLKWYSHSFEDRSRGPYPEFAMFKNGQSLPGQHEQTEAHKRSRRL